MRTASAAILRSAFSDSIRLGGLDAFLATLGAKELERLHYDFEVWARDDQLPPATAAGGSDWTTWLMLGGRGAGKTRAGAEWVRALVQRSDLAPDAATLRIALVGETLTDARAVMVEGVSGLLAVHPPAARPRYEPSKRQVTWANGAIAQLFSAEDPDSLRGPQFAAAWCDELGKWRRPDDTWDTLQFCLRLGTRPRQVVTTTPRPIGLIKALLADPQTAVTRVSTAANAANLAPSFLEAIVGRYRGTRLGRQELDAELLEDRADALWSRGLIERARVRGNPPLSRIVVAVDPPASSGPHADACGIIVAGLAEDGRALCACRLHLRAREPVALGESRDRGLPPLRGGPHRRRDQSGRRAGRDRHPANRSGSSGARGAGDARQMAAGGARGRALRAGARRSCRRLPGARRRDERLRA
jgi:phage terminase large subunit-like protein